MSEENIWTVAGDGILEKVKSYIVEGCDINAKDSFGYTPIHAAAAYAQMGVLNWLIDNGANVNVIDADGDTPLHHCESVEPAQLLIAKGANVYQQNAAGETPLSSAEESESEELAAFLREAMASGRSVGAVP
ncbi:unnamed protein product [Phaeothamnion confervicola]